MSSTAQRTRVVTRSQSKQISEIQNQEITRVYSELFASIKGKLVGADESKKELQLIMWNQQQISVIQEGHNIHIDNESMYEIYLDHSNWQYLMAGDGTSMSHKIMNNNFILAHQATLWKKLENKDETYNDQKTKQWRERVMEASQTANKPFETIFKGMFYWIIQLFIYNLSARILKF